MTSRIDRQLPSEFEADDERTRHTMQSDDPDFEPKIHVIADNLSKLAF